MKDCETCPIKDFVHANLYCQDCETKRQSKNIDLHDLECMKTQNAFNGLSHDEFCSINFRECFFELQSQILHNLLRSDITCEEMGDMIAEYEEKGMSEIKSYFNGKK